MDICLQKTELHCLEFCKFTKCQKLCSFIVYLGKFARPSVNLNLKNVLKAKFFYDLRFYKKNHAI